MSQKLRNRHHNSHKPTTRQLGGEIEAEVCQYLEHQGLTLVRKNYSCKLGEIDLIMIEKETLVFVEVRYRKNDIYGSGADTITYRKQRRIIRAAQMFILSNPNYTNANCRIDVASVQPSSNPMHNHISWIKNAFEAHS